MSPLGFLENNRIKFPIPRKTGSQQELNQDVQTTEGRKEQFRAERRNSQLLRQGQLTLFWEFASFWEGKKTLQMFKFLFCKKSYNQGPVLSIRAPQLGVLFFLNAQFLPDFPRTVSKGREPGKGWLCQANKHYQELFSLQLFHV